MLKTRGVTSLFDGRDFGLLKQQALLFDKLYLRELTSDVDALKGYPEKLKADVEFLQEPGVIAGPAETPDSLRHWPVPVDKNDPIRNPRDVCDDPDCEARKVVNAVLDVRRTIDDYLVRSWAAWLATDKSAEYLPVCRRKLPANIATPNGQQGKTSSHEMLNLILAKFPVPSEDCPWESILDFRNETEDKRWHLHRFMRELGTKQKTASEIDDDIEWLLSEYDKAMRLHKLKASQSFLEVFIVSPVEIIEDLVKFRWSKIATGLLSVSKRKVELMEAELKAPGRECAYIFDARQRFGRLNS